MATTNELKALAARNATAVGAGHTFVVTMREGYPINVLGRIKDVPEVCGIYCATANPAQVVVAESEQGRGVLGVIDGVPPKGVETAEDAEGARRSCRDKRKARRNLDSVAPAERISEGRGSWDHGVSAAGGSGPGGGACHAPRPPRESSMQ